MQKDLGLCNGGGGGDDDGRGVWGGGLSVVHQHMKERSSASVGSNVSLNYWPSCSPWPSTVFN